MNSLNKKVSMINLGDSEIRQLSNETKIEAMCNEIYNIAERYNVNVSENAHKIARARVLTNCPLNLCICDRNDPDRGCISPKCMKEIEESGICHCRCYVKKG